ncbi:MAG: LuxR C-terminal-related transcriptional regulator [Acidimicrobiia bacterium]|nr:LuxR C-terminal-related transcriptional regulator [Acidimicrobiia bacterium]
MPVRLAAIVAPAGYGKTTLVQAWCDHLSSTRTIGWLSLDERDADPVRFWTYLTGCLERCGARLDDRLLADVRSDPDAADDLIVALVTKLASLERPLTVVLKDLHRVANGDVAEWIFGLVEMAPDNVMFVVISRTSPWPLTAMEGRGDAVVLGPDDLAFDRDETTALLTQTTGLSGIESTAIETVHRRTQGLPVLVQLAADGINRQSNPDRLVAGLSETNRFVGQYLLEEVLSALQPELRQFLLDLSISDRFSVDLAAAVIDGPATELVEALRSELVFVSADERDEWFGPHPLVRDRLEAELSRQDPARARLLHHRAGKWHRQQGDSSRAVEHLIAAEAFGEAIDLIAEVMLDYWSAGRVTTVLRWLDLLPLEQIDTQPGAASELAQMLSALGRFDEASGWLDVAARAARSDDQWLDVHFGRLVLERGRGDVEATLAAADAIDDLAQRAADSDTRATIARRQVEALLFRAACYEIRGEDDKRRAAAARFEANRAVASPAVAFSAELLEARWSADDGQLAEAERQARLQLRSAEQKGLLDFHMIGHAHMALARVAWCRGQLDEARASLSDASRIDYRGGAQVKTFQAVCAAEILASAGRHDRADEILQSAWDGEPTSPTSEDMRLFVAGWGLWVSAVHNRHLEAQRWQIELLRSGLIETLPLPLWARYLLVSERPEPIVARFSVDGTTLPTEPLIRLRCGLVLHAALQMMGQHSEAVNLARGLLSGAEQYELIQPLIDEPRLVTGFDPHGSHGPSQYFLSRIQPDTSSSPARVTVPASILVEQLSPRELDIVRYLPTRMTNKQIASELYVSLNTVKSHLRSIYRKLGVTTRDDAIDQCRELDLL